MNEVCVSLTSWPLDISISLLSMGHRLKWPADPGACVEGYHRPAYCGFSPILASKNSFFHWIHLFIVICPSCVSSPRTGLCLASKMVVNQLKNSMPASKGRAIQKPLILPISVPGRPHVFHACFWRQHFNHIFWSQRTYNEGNWTLVECDVCPKKLEMFCGRGNWQPLWSHSMLRKRIQKLEMTQKISQFLFSIILKHVSQAFLRAVRFCPWGHSLFDLLFNIKSSVIVKLDVIYRKLMYHI